MAARGVRHMDVANLPGVAADVVTEAALVELHVVDVVEDFQQGRPHHGRQLRRHLGGGQEVAHVVRGDVQGLQIHADAALLRNVRAVVEGVEHGAELDGVGEIIIMVHHHAALAQGVGVDGDRPGADFLRGVYALPEERQIVRLLGGVDEGEIRVPVETGDDDPGSFGGGLHSDQVLVRPAPEFHSAEAVFLRRPEAVQKGKLRIKRLDAGAFDKIHRAVLLAVSWFQSSESLRNLQDGTGKRQKIENYL